MGELGSILGGLFRRGRSEVPPQVGNEEPDHSTDVIPDWVCVVLSRFPHDYHMNTAGNQLDISNGRAFYNGREVLQSPDGEYFLAPEVSSISFYKLPRWAQDEIRASGPDRYVQMTRKTETLQISGRTIRFGGISVSDIPE